jgi:hypothetical protein
MFPTGELPSVFSIALTRFSAWFDLLAIAGDIVEAFLHAFDFVEHQ